MLPAPTDFQYDDDVSTDVDSSTNGCLDVPYYYHDNRKHVHDQQYYTDIKGEIHDKLCFQHPLAIC